MNNGTYKLELVKPPEAKPVEKKKERLSGSFALLGRFSDAWLAIWTVVLVGALDANVKGRLVAAYGWENLERFWQDHLGWSWPVALFGTFSVMLWMCGKMRKNWRALVYFLFLGSAAAEFLVYWFMLPAFGIAQEAHWIPGRPPVSWFQWPPEAPWLNPLPLARLFSAGETVHLNGVLAATACVLVGIFWYENIRRKK